MMSRRWLLATLAIVAVGLGFVVGRVEKEAAAQGNAPKADIRIGKYQFSTYTSDKPAGTVSCLMFDTETGELWSSGPIGSPKAWHKVLPGLPPK
jgi:hypothetical protein